MAGRNYGYQYDTNPRKIKPEYQRKQTKKVVKKAKPITKKTTEIKKNIETKNKIIEPPKGTLKKKHTIKVIKILETKATIKGGIVFEINISSLVKGLTINWLKVPSSLSLAIDRADNNMVNTMPSIAIMLTVKNHLYSIFGLNQFLVMGLIWVFLMLNFFSSSKLYWEMIWFA